MKKLIKWLAISSAITAAFVFLGGAASIFLPTVKEPPPNQARIALEKKQSEALNAAIIRVLTKAKDAGSIEFTYAGIPDNLSAICLEFYGRNGFGARVKSAALLAVTGDKVKFFMDDLPSQAVALWNKNCGNKEKSVTDYVDVANKRAQRIVSLGGV